MVGNIREDITDVTGFHNDISFGIMLSLVHWVVGNLVYC